MVLPLNFTTLWKLTVQEQDITKPATQTVDVGLDLSPEIQPHFFDTRDPAVSFSFQPVQAKYFRFVVDASFANTHFTHLQEVGAF